MSGGDAADSGSPDGIGANSRRRRPGGQNYTPGGRTLVEMGTNQETAGVGEQYCPNCRAVVSEEAVRCPECGTDLEGPIQGGRTADGGTGSDNSALLVGGSAVCAVLGAGSFLLGLLFGPFVLATVLFSLVGTVLGAVAYRRYDSTAGLVAGVVNGLEFLGVVGLVVLFLLLVLGVVAIGLSGGSLPLATIAPI